MLVMPSQETGESMIVEVNAADHGSDTEYDSYVAKKHGRSSSSDQVRRKAPHKADPSIEANSTPVSPNGSTPHTAARPSNKRRKSSTSGKTKARPAYSRRYSTPPSRPLSPAGFPKLLGLDHSIPEIDLAESTVRLSKPISIPAHLLSVDTGPQEPDIWSDPETDYFSTAEGPVPKHMRGKSRRHVSQNVSNASSLNAMVSTNSTLQGLGQISEDVEPEFWLPPTPGGFAV